MHQPFYKDLISGEYKLPWTRMHALKDYYGMVRILEEFPEIRQTFNLVPSMMVQIEEYASGTARDPFMELALKPAEALTPGEQTFMLRHFFQANVGRMIFRYPRYGELFQAWQAQKASGSAKGVFGVQEFRDLQMLSQLAWFDEYYQSQDPATIEWIRKGRNYTPEEQTAMGLKQREIIAGVIPQYKKLAATGQIEISTTPFYHPILPLVCDSDIGGVSHPGIPLPKRFRYPADARLQMEMARDYVSRVFGVAPVGLWPSEGSVSDEVFALAAEVGFKWAATDNGVLERTLGRGVGVESTYQPWRWKQGKNEINVIFRDHLMSDLIGFVYSGMHYAEAASDFLRRIRENCSPILDAGRDALVPIILDGENAWEYYELGGRPFLRELYGGIQRDRQMEAITLREGFERLSASPLDHIFPGSWISANFDVWIGDEEDNKAWDFLLDARETYDKAVDSAPDRRKLALEELLIAEGSDWCWWYGPHHDSANREEFDELFRAHIANVYRALGKMPPQELSRPILNVIVSETQSPQTGVVRVKVDGAVTSYFEWLGAGIYRVNGRGGSMHGKRYPVRELYYGSDGDSLFLRFDFQESDRDLLSQLDVRLCVRKMGSEEPKQYHLRMDSSGVSPIDGNLQCAFRDVLEVGAPLPETGHNTQFQASLWHDGLPVEALPAQGWITVNVADPNDWSL